MELSLCHKLRFSNPYIFATQWRWPAIFQIMNTVRSNLKNQRFTSSGCNDISIKRFEFVSETQFLLIVCKILIFPPIHTLKAEKELWYFPPPSPPHPSNYLNSGVGEGGGKGGNIRALAALKVCICLVLHSNWELRVWSG